MAKKKMTLEEKLEEAIVKDANYELPSNWNNIFFGTIMSIEGGTQPPKSQFLFEPTEGYIRLYQIRDFSSENFHTYVKDEKKLRIMSDEDIMIARYGASIGKIFRGRKGAYNVALAKLIYPKELYDVNFLYWFLKSDLFQNNLGDMSRTAVAGFNKNDLKNFIVPLPPLKEQQRIVDKIESLFEKLDNAKELIEEARDNFEKRKSAILEKAFRGELTKEWRKDNKIKDEFVDVLLGDIIEEGPQNGLYKPQSAYGEGNMIVRIDNFYNGKINPWDTLKKLKLTEDDIGRYSLENGDIIINRVNSIEYLGKSALVRGLNEICVFESNIMRAKLKENINNEYVIYYLNSLRGLYELRKTAKHAVNQASINQQDVKKALVPLPSLEEQNEVVKILDNLLKAESKVEELTTLEEQIELIKKSILAKAFRGQLGTNCEDDESALDVLKEILNKE